MIGVPLSGGKTLNVTFRSLNTRGDLFKSYNRTGAATNSPRRPHHKDILLGLQATALGTITNSSIASNRLARSGAPGSHRAGLHNQSMSSAQGENEDSILMGEHRKEELKKVVQMGVMRGLSSHRQTRKNSRMSRLMNPNEKTYMQIKMRHDGVVPF